MTERPILFSAPMVLALLDGSKTQTRRTCKPAEMAALAHVVSLGDGRFGDAVGDVRFACPYGAPGDRLWVRETWYCDHWQVQKGPYVEVPEARDLLVYRADGDRPYEAEQPVWRPNIHMPRWACRILLEIVSVRVERLQEISETDADAEGCERLEYERYTRDRQLCPKCDGLRLHRTLGPNGGVIEDVDCVECDTYVKRYRHLWESINGVGSWAANQWVWVVEFKRVTT